MVSQNIIQKVRSYAQEFGVQSVWMFGSALEDEDQATDIDLAVEGLAPDKFFDFYARLYFELPKPVDLVDMSQNPPIAIIIRKKESQNWGDE